MTICFSLLCVPSWQKHVPSTWNRGGGFLSLCPSFLSFSVHLLSTPLVWEGLAQPGLRDSWNRAELSSQIRLPLWQARTRAAQGEELMRQGSSSQEWLLLGGSSRGLSLGLTTEDGNPLLGSTPAWATLSQSSLNHPERPCCANCALKSHPKRLPQGTELCGAGGEVRAALSPPHTSWPERLLFFLSHIFDLKHFTHKKSVAPKNFLETSLE